MRKLITSWLTWLGFKVGRVAAKVIDARKVKFPKGTQWTCPECSEVLGVAQVDVYPGDRCTPAQWNAPIDPRLHCDVRTIRNNESTHQIHTPAGWVG